MAAIRTGLDRFIAGSPSLPGRGRLALLCNATTISAAGLPTAEAIAACPGARLERILTPQHGFAAEKQDNMVPSSNGLHSRLRVPLISLYGEQREPDDSAFDGIDALAIDLQDAGTRVYTFLITALFTLRRAIARGVPVIVLDRPNPIGGAIDGPVLEEGFHSFVGIADTPLRHGLSAAEYILYGAWRLGWIPEASALRIAAAARRDALGDEAGDAGRARHAGLAGLAFDQPLSILPLAGWRREMYYDETGLLWTMPSPNLPALETAIVYPGQVILEGTNLSEGRGTTRPFEICGAPYLDPAALIAALAEVAGVMLREVAFEPTFQKHAERTCRGFHLHVLDRAAFSPVRFTLSLLAAIRRTHGDAFAWREPPYEYEWERMPVDLICGTDRVRRAIDAGDDCAGIASGWAEEIAAYRERIAPLLIYPEARG